MSQARYIRDTKLEELKKLKNRKTTEPEILASMSNEPTKPEKPPSRPLTISQPELIPNQLIQNDPFKTEKPQSKPLTNPQPEPKPTSSIPNNPFRLEKPIEKPSEKQFPSFPMDPEAKIPPIDSEDQGIIELQDYILIQLQKQLQFLENKEKDLRNTSENLDQELNKLRSDRDTYLTSYDTFKKACENTQKMLENELDKLKGKNKKQKITKTPYHKSAIASEITELQTELKFLIEANEEKDEEIAYLENDLHKAKEEANKLNNLMNSGVFSSQPEPPPPSSDIHEQGPRRLLSDVGSTGAWSAHQKILEESKMSQFASPDPFENHYHQSTGETSQMYKEEPATPPHEYPQDYETRNNFEDHEEEKNDTPKRKNAGKTNFYVS
ncbi:hypothetical protein SteCoe_15441 [Stentor coeruleus]|uniref:Uncharacterized protein n=1 Tax=Stentor coeruleus TaxID=5963 RepID=A0A1R2C3N2_9CILI|nr:hypothetical protein SteCoe_15441 [Stentor coeruleus]